MQGLRPGSGIWYSPAAFFLQLNGLFIYLTKMGQVVVNGAP